MKNYRAEVSIFYSGGKRKVGNLPLESSATETFSEDDDDKARETFFAFIEKYISKEGHEEDTCFKAKLYRDNDLLHELDACSPEMLKELTPERRSEIMKLIELWEAHRKRGGPPGSMAAKMQSGSS